MAENAAVASASRPLLEGELLNEYRFKWTAFPAIKGYLRMYPGDFCKLFPRGRWIIKTAKHVSAVVDGTIHDTFRPDPFRCVCGAWQLALGLSANLEAHAAGCAARGECALNLNAMATEPLEDSYAQSHIVSYTFI